MATIVIEVLFAKLTGLAADLMKEQVLEAVRAMVEQEIFVEDINRLPSEPLKTAQIHLRNAVLEPIEARRRQHIENARLKFLEASSVDTPIASVRAAFYSGLCHRLLDEPGPQLAEYQRAFSIAQAIEHGLNEKIDAVGAKDLTITQALIGGAAKGAFGITGIAIEQYHKRVRSNLRTQIAVVEKYKASIKAAIKSSAPSHSA